MERKKNSKKKEDKSERKEVREQMKERKKKVKTKGNIIVKMRLTNKLTEIFKPKKIDTLT